MKKNIDIYHSKRSYSILSLIIGFLCAIILLITTFASQVFAYQTADTTVMQVSAPVPGSLLSVEAKPTSKLLSHAGQQYLITYRSRGANGEPIVASGYVLIPEGQPPEDGWPVLAWAHGTTGVADICAPSTVYPGGPEYDYHKLVLNTLDWWLAHGYAVVAPDYEGLGTPGGHPYMNADSQLHTVVDAVRALNRLRPNAISSNWIVMGHSQGGAAALAVASRADAPELNLRGAIPIAPGGYHYAGIAQYAIEHGKLSPGVAAFIPIVLLGAEAAKPSLHIGKLISEEMQPLMDLARSRCLSGLRKEVNEPLSRVFKKNANLEPLLNYLDKQSIEQMLPDVPVLLIQGSADKLVNPLGTYAYYQNLCKADKTVFYHTVPNGSHRDALRRSPSVVKGFLAYLNGHKQMQPCSADPAFIK